MGQTIEFKKYGNDASHDQATGTLPNTTKNNFNDYYTFSNKDIPKPPCLQEMLDVSRKLSEPFSQVRIDFYVINNEPVFGEMTFTAGWGFFTNDFYNYLGSKITLSKLSQ